MGASTLSLTKPGLLLAALAVVGLGTPTLTDAASVRQRVSLHSTARTLGGPGVATVNAGDSVNVLKFAPQSEETQLLCATAHNFGPGKAVLKVSGGPGGTKMVNATQTRSLCTEGSAVSLSCEQGPCEVIWRVDRGY